MSISSNSAIYFIYTVLSYSVPQYLERFVRTGLSGYGEYCAERLCRIRANGERKELPCWLELQVETLNHIFVFLFWWLCLQRLFPSIFSKTKDFLEQHTSHESAVKFQIIRLFSWFKSSLILLFSYRQAAKTKKPIDVSVALMDGRTISLHLDSASTSAEVCQALAEKINLRDTRGFSLYISLYDKVRFNSLSLVSTYPFRPSLPWFAYKCAHTELNPSIKDCRELIQSFIARCGLWTAVGSMCWMQCPSASRRWGDGAKTKRTPPGGSPCERNCSHPGMTAQ